jgi:hypothetical protein
VSVVVDSYRTLCQAGTSHADAIDVLLVRFDLDRQTLRRQLQHSGVMREHFREEPSPASRADYLQHRARGAKKRRAADRGRNGRPAGKKRPNVNLPPSTWEKPT